MIKTYCDICGREHARNELRGFKEHFGARCVKAPMACDNCRSVLRAEVLALGRHCEAVLESTIHRIRENSLGKKNLVAGAGFEPATSGL